MTNYEYYKDKLIDYLSMHISVINGEPIPCGRSNCSECEFKKVHCDHDAFSWLKSEHTDPPKLTHEDVALLNILSDGYIARDEDGDLFWYNRHISKRSSMWMFDKTFSSVGPLSLKLTRGYFTPENFFTFITWDDEEPWSVEDLRKLEVME